MGKLESLLDAEVETYLRRVKDRDEIQELLSGTVDRKTYSRLLRTFYIIEHISQRAVNMASINTRDSAPYLSRRFHSCAQGELGHAEVALRDLKDLGEDEPDPASLETAGEYDGFLQRAAEEFPPAVLGHSYLFENVSGLLFPEVKSVPHPSMFIEVHAREDPAHSVAIRKTVRKVEKTLGEKEIERIAEFSRKSGDYLMRLFDSLA